MQESLISNFHLFSPSVEHYLLQANVANWPARAGREREIRPAACYRLRALKALSVRNLKTE